MFLPRERNPHSLSKQSKLEFYKIFPKKSINCINSQPIFLLNLLNLVKNKRNEKFEYLKICF